MTISLWSRWRRRSAAWKAGICRFCQGCAEARVGPGRPPLPDVAGEETTGFKWLPAVKADRCNACGRCVQACVHECLAMSDRLPLLLKPDACRAEERCLRTCPEAAIVMRWTRAHGSLARGRWRI